MGKNHKVKLTLDEALDRNPPAPIVLMLPGDLRHYFSQERGELYVETAEQSVVPKSMAKSSDISKIANGMPHKRNL